MCLSTRCALDLEHVPEGVVLRVVRSEVRDPAGASVLAGAVKFSTRVPIPSLLSLYD